MILLFASLKLNFSFTTFCFSYYFYLFIFWREMLTWIRCDLKRFDTSLFQSTCNSKVNLFSDLSMLYHNSTFTNGDVFEFLIVDTFLMPWKKVSSVNKIISETFYVRPLYICWTIFELKRWQKFCFNDQEIE